MKYSILLILIFACSTFGQSAKLIPPHQKVVIEKSNGDRLTGLFVGGGTDSIIIEISGTKVPISFQEIKLIWVGEAKTETTVAQNNLIDYTGNAVKYLRKLSAATSVGVNFQDYSRRLIDVKAEVEDALLNITDENARNEIKLAMDAYADAATAWNDSIKNRGYLFTNFEPGITLRSKYNLSTTKLGDLVLITKETALSTIWAAAEKHINLVGIAKAGNSTTADESGITGLWKITISNNGQSLSLNIGITREGESYFATLEPSRSDAIKTVINKIGNSFSFNYSDAGKLGSISFEGVYENNTMKGVTKLTQSGQSDEAVFTGLK